MSIKLFDGEIEVGEFDSITVAYARCECVPVDRVAFVLEIGTLTHSTFESSKGKQYKIVGPEHTLYNCRLEEVRTPKMPGDIWPYVTVLRLEGTGYLNINNERSEYI